LYENYKQIKTTCPIVKDNYNHKEGVYKMTYTKQNDKRPIMRQSLAFLSNALIIGLMSTSFAAEVQNKEAYYAKLTRGWEQNVPDEHKEINKSAHLYLKEHKPSYRIHRADLRFSLFPLNNRDHFGSLVKSWEDKLDNLPPFLGKIHSTYQAYLDLPVEDQDVSYKQRAELGAAITMSKWENNDRTKTNEDRLKRLTQIINDNDFPEELRAKAEYNLIEHKVKHSMIDPTSPPILYTLEKARDDYRRLLNLADPITKASIVYHVAELDELGNSILAPDISLAQIGYSAVVGNPASHPFTKRLARSKLEGIAKKVKLDK
jgi:hypothetical protein